MRYLSLFTGAGGGDLACQHLLGWTCMGYVEIDDYCQRLIRQRQDDGVLDKAPVFGDVKAFLSDGYAAGYSGMVDGVTGGFPCQPFSVAGQRRGEDDERNMWPATIATIREVRPRFCFLENVPGLLASGYYGRILGDLAESGYDSRWRILSAAEVGAPHRRDRVWIVVHADSAGLQGLYNETGGKRMQSTSGDVPRYEWNATPRICGRVNGVAKRMDRLKAVGNGQVPLVAATAWRLLTEEDE